jgi:hypothetical protein
MAQKLAHELGAAQQRISELEAKVVAHRNQAERAEQWLHKVYTEIKDRFLRQEKERSAPSVTLRFVDASDASKRSAVVTVKMAAVAAHRFGILARPCHSA